MCCGPATSVECRPPSMWTNALPSRARCRASASVNAFRMRQTPGDLPIAIDSREVRLGRHQREVERPPLRRLTGVDDLHAIARRVKLLEIVDDLIVGGELVIGARGEAEHGVGRRYAALCQDRHLDQRDRDGNQSHSAYQGQEDLQEIRRSGDQEVFDFQDK